MKICFTDCWRPLPRTESHHSPARLWVHTKQGKGIKLESNVVNTGIVSLVTLCFLMMNGHIFRWWFCLPTSPQDPSFFEISSLFGMWLSSRCYGSHRLHPAPRSLDKLLLNQRKPLLHVNLPLYPLPLLQKV